MANSDNSDDQDLFGLGVRLSYYFQWVGLIIEDQWLTPKHRLIRVPLIIFTFASLLALVIRASDQSRNDNAVVVLYINSLLTFGFWFRLLPKYVYGIVAQFHPDWRDKWNGLIFRPEIDNKMGKKQKKFEKFFDCLWLGLLIVVLIFLLYFWGRIVEPYNTKTSPGYGFLFCKVALGNKWFQNFNITCSALLLAGLSMEVFVRVTKPPGETPTFISKIRSRFRGNDSEEEVGYEKERENIVKAFVIAFIITGTELSIRWNKIEGAYSLKSTGQLISLVTGIVAFLRVIHEVRERSYKTKQGN